MAGSRSRASRRWRWDGARVAAKYAQPFGEAMQRVKKKNHGQIEAADIVDEARPKASPIHPLFEWDDRKAAEAHRQGQARAYMRQIVVEIVPVRGDPVTMPAVVSFGSGVGYRDMVDVMQTPDLRDRMLRQALAEAEAWMVRYQSLEELSGVFEEITRTRAAAEGPRTAATA